jgi:hypothetical protein
MTIAPLVRSLRRSNAARGQQPGAPAPPPDLATALRAIANFILIALFVQLAIDAVEHFADGVTLSSSGVLIVNGLFLGLFLGRREAKTETTSPALWLLAASASRYGFLQSSNRPSMPASAWTVGSDISDT